MDTTRQALEKALKHMDCSDWGDIDVNGEVSSPAAHDIRQFPDGCPVCLIRAALTSMDAAPQGVVEAGIEREVKELREVARRYYSGEQAYPWAAVRDQLEITCAAIDAAKSRTTPAEPDTDIVEKIMALVKTWIQDGIGTDPIPEEEWKEPEWVKAEADLRTRLTPLLRTNSVVALRSGGYDELFKWLMEGGEAVGTAHFAYPVPVGRLRKGVLLEAVDQYQCVHISGLPFEAKQQAAFTSECTRLGLQYILIQPEQK